MRALIDISGQRFGRLVALQRGENTLYGNVQWDCVCDCGSYGTFQGASLRAGKQNSCGCLKRETFAARGTTRKSADPEDQYQRWSAIRDRCYRESHPNYRDYGGRGIVMHDPWRDDYKAFQSWILENLGPTPPKHSLDRIDNDRGYEPGNLRWATQAEQMKNTRPKVSNRQLDDMRTDRDLWRQRAISCGFVVPLDESIREM